jgi:V8-like Glu-specific endopeptidase
MKWYTIVAFLIVLLFSSGCASLLQPCNQWTVLYGEDDRVDIYTIKNQQILNNADAVASIWEKYQIVDNGDGTSTLTTSVFGPIYNLAETERFYSQPIGAHCTAFLVAPDIVVTAGHCTNVGNIKRKRFVFGFRMTSKTECKVRISNSRIFKASYIMAHNLTTSGVDYAVIRLEKKVDIQPLKVSNRDAKYGDCLYILGHPCGSPLKLADGARVVNSINAAYFVASLDSYGGNSGSPVFNDRHEVVGILVRGESDFEAREDGKRISRQGRFGESCTKVSRWKKYIP